jgi:hypothetical protein
MTTFILKNTLHIINTGGRFPAEDHQQLAHNQSPVPFAYCMDTRRTASEAAKKRARMKCITQNTATRQKSNQTATNDTFVSPSAHRLNSGNR